MAPKRIPPEERLAKNTKREGGCLVWTGPQTHDGYGVMGIGRNKQFRAHRVAFQLANGPIPAGLLVCHSCDKPLCVEPTHLFLGTPLDNMRDMIRKGRKRAPKGEQHPGAKLTNSQAEEIKSLRESGEKLLAIATKFGVSFQHISSICNRRSRV